MVSKQNDNLEQEDEQFEEPVEEQHENNRKKGFWSVFIFSALLHSIIILLTIFVIIASNQMQKDDVIVTTSIIEVPEEDKYDPEVKRDVIKQEVDVTVNTDIQAPVVVTNEQVTDHNETENDREAETAEGTEEGISDQPQVGSGLMGNIGGGGGGGGTFGTRSGGGKKRAILRGGGNAKTESSVDAALRWLARHQEQDGRWDSAKYGNTAFNYGRDTAISGLAALAFLAAGHTPKIGKFKTTVKASIEWILSKQNADGSFGDRFEHQIYDDAICTLALCEAFGMYPDPKIKAAAQKGIDYIYSARGAQVHFNTNQDGVPLSVSVLGWVMMAYKSAKIAGLHVPEDIFEKIKKRVDEMTEKDQSGNLDKVHYLKFGDRKGQPDAMTAVGMLVNEYLGVNRFDLTLMADRLSKNPPATKGGGLSEFDFYRWYYATLAMFQYGGEQWKTWNKALIETLVGTQRKGGPLDGSINDVDGSWDPEQDRWGKEMGRVYTTAMGAFCLEVYYRYASVMKK